MPPKRPAKQAAGRRVVPDDGPTPAEEGHKDETPQPPPTQPTQPTQPVLASETVEAAVPAQPIAEHVPPKKKVGRPRKNVAPAPPPGEAGASEPPPATFVATGDQEASPSSEVPKPKKRGRKKAGGEEATVATGKPVNETEDVPAVNEVKTTGEKTKRKPGRPRKEQQRQEGGTQGEATMQVEEDKPKRRPGRPRKEPTAESGAEVAKTASQPSGVEITPAEKPRKKIGRPRKNEPPASEPPSTQQQEQEQHDASHNVQHDDESAIVGQNLSDPQPKLEEERPSVASTAAPTTTTTTTTTIAPAEAAATSEPQKTRRKVGRPRKSELVQESTIAATSVPQAADAIVDSGGTQQRGRKRAHSQSEGDSQAPIDVGTNVDAPPAKTRRRPGRPKKSEVQSPDEPAAEGSSVQPQQETSADVGTTEKPKRERKPFDLHTMPLPKPQADNAKSTPQEQSSANDEQQVSEQTGKSRRGRKKRPPQPATVNEQDVESTETSKDMDTDAPRVSKKRGRPRKQPEAPPSTTAQKRRAVDDESQATEPTNKPADTDEQEVVSPPQKKNKSEHISDSEEGVDLSSPPPKDAQDMADPQDMDMVDPRQEKLQEQLQSMQARRLAAAHANREEVFAEHQRAKTSPRMQVQHERKRAEAEKILEREQIEKAGGDYERHRAWTYTAEEAERWDEQQEIKAKRAETGFSDYNQMAQKKYDRQMREFKPDLQAYEEQKRMAMEDPSGAAGEENFYRDANSLSFASVDNKPSREAVDRLVSDVQKQEDRREKYSRQKPVNEEDDITYINERNRRFNDKIDRFYGKHTKEIRENFERGTAL